MEACQFEEKRDCKQHEVRSWQGRRLNPLDENYWVDQHDEKVCDLGTDDDSVAQVAQPGEFFQSEAKGWETHEAHTSQEGQVVVWIPYLTCCYSELIYDIRVRNRINVTYEWLEGHGLILDIFVDNSAQVI